MELPFKGEGREQATPSDSPRAPNNALQPIGPDCSLFPAAIYSLPELTGSRPGMPTVVARNRD